MKLNNKGFAITAVLYGLLILFVILVSSYLLVLSAKKDRVDDLVNEIENNYTPESEKTLLTEHIKQLYLNNKNKKIKNNSIEYQYSESINLMNDRLGGTTSDYDAGNIRYYGKNPNNYVDIGDRDSEGNIIFYRIIGIFRNLTLVNDDGSTETKDLVKVIRSESIGTYQWNLEINDWSEATLMKYLNPGYSSSQWWNENISNNAKSKIETVTWNLGGSTSAEIYTNVTYGRERGTSVFEGRPTTWTGKVALMYASDYGYAADFNNCSNTLVNYDATSCKNNDWLYNTDKTQWFLTPNGEGKDKSVHILNSAGKVYNNYYVYNSYLVRPSFFLKSKLYVVSGDGTTDKPYVIK